MVEQSCELAHSAWSFASFATRRAAAASSRATVASFATRMAAAASSRATDASTATASRRCTLLLLLRQLLRGLFRESLASAVLRSVTATRRAKVLPTSARETVIKNVPERVPLVQT